jgi:hypothetical protein
VAASVTKDLGGGLVLRSASSDDADALDEFMTEVFLERDGSPDPAVVRWGRDLVELPHPTFRPELFSIVEDTATGEIVSGTCLIPQTWRYGDIPFAVGRPELVGVREEYRGRGLMRRHLDVVHRRSDEMGHLAQAITGVPWLYRRFGYEMAVALGGGRRCPIGAVPDLKDGEREQFTFRPAAGADAGFLAATYGAAMERYPVSTLLDEGVWRYLVEGRSPDNVHRRPVEVIERSGEPVGMVVRAPRGWEGALWVTVCELIEGVSWGEAGPAVLRRLRALASEMEERPWALRFSAADHPLYAAAPHLLSSVGPGYAWYIRVPDLVGFLGHVTPVLEARLAAGPFRGHTGRVQLNLYTSGISFQVSGGALEVGEWTPGHVEDGDVAVPDPLFLRMVFGSSSFEELQRVMPDCVPWTPAAVPLLEAMFPKRPASVMGLA